ncbi:MAG: fibronectin type III domain-containing protein, partial [Patescibacteria group bacterium]|nr:fibronectin type III domain-containing protein [Patescibacteria group bacterium]
FNNNDAEFWYLKNPTGTGNVVVTMSGSTSAVIGAYAFSGVNQTQPIPAHVVKHNTSASSPAISITTKYPNDWVLDLPSIYGGVTLGSPSCTQEWNVNMPNAITGASSTSVVSSPTAYTCNWIASGGGDLWDDAAIEMRADTSSSSTTSTSPSAPTGLTATAGNAQISLSWTAPSSNGGSAVTGYEIERSTNGGTFSVLVQNTGSTSTTYSDTGLSSSTTYTYRVSAINSVGTSSPSNTASATTNSISGGGTTGGNIVLNNVQSTSGTLSSSPHQITISNFNAGTGNNRLLVVGVSANNNAVSSITFGGVPLTQAVSSFNNNDAEFWYLKNPTGTGNVVVTMSGSTSAVIGAYAFSGVNQTQPIP